MKSIILIITMAFIGNVQLSVVTRNNFTQIDDMLLDQSSIERRSQLVSLNMPPSTWTYGIIPYEISPRLYNKKSLIESAMKHISSQVPCIQFRPRYYEDNYLQIVHSESDECLSYVGMVGGPQELFLGHSCLKFGIILHELMHALGFFHEHNRPDRDDYLFIFYENIREDKMDNFIKIAKSEYRMVTHFDYNSIMIYGETAFSKNNLPTMLPLDMGHRLTNPQYKTRISSSDIHALEVYYNCI